MLYSSDPVQLQVFALQISTSWTNFEVLRFIEDFWRRLCAATVDAINEVDDGKRGFLLNFQSQVSCSLLSCFESKSLVIVDEGLSEYSSGSKKGENS